MRRSLLASISSCCSAPLHARRGQGSCTAPVAVWFTGLDGSIGTPFASVETGLDVACGWERFDLASRRAVADARLTLVSASAADAPVDDASRRRYVGLDDASGTTWHACAGIGVRFDETRAVQGGHRALTNGRDFSRRDVPLDLSGPVIGLQVPV